MKPYPRYHYDIIQGSDRWFEARLGNVTASRFSEACAKGRGGGESTTRNKLLNALAYERIENEPYPEKFKTTDAMQNGTDTESEARDYFAELMGFEIRQVGYVEYNEDIGCSPDGLIGEDGLAELKCPLLSTHLDYIRSDGKKLLSTYKKQVNGQLFVTGRRWCYLVSYCPLWRKRPLIWVKIERDEEEIKKLHINLVMFIEDLKKTVIELDPKSPY